LRQAPRRSRAGDHSCDPGLGADEAVVLEVHNGGTPIAPDQLPHLFEPYRRGDQGHASGSSLGLGLFIAQEIARSHGGSITVTSSESDGTTFRVRLPRGI
jgi:signal transduction histidine kinase